MRWIVLAAALSAFSAPALADIPPLNEAEQAVRGAGAAVHAFFENFNAGSAEGIASTYSDRPEFVWIEGGHTAYVSKAEAVAGVKAALETMKGARMEIGPGFRAFATGPGTVFAYVPATIYVKDAQGAEKAMGESLTTMTLVLENGEWRILTGHTAVDPAQ